LKERGERGGANETGDEIKWETEIPAFRGYTERGTRGEKGEGQEIAAVLTTQQRILFVFTTQEKRKTLTVFI